MSTLDFTNVRLETPNGIPYKFLGINGSESLEKASATAELVILSADLDEFIEECLPTPLVIAGFVTILPGLSLGGAPWLVAQSIDWESAIAGLTIDPFGTDPNAPAGTYSPLAKLTVKFETSVQNEENEPDENNPETFLERSLDAGVQYLTIPPEKTEIALANDESDFFANEDEELGVFKIIPTIEHILKWKWALRPAWTTIYAALGKVNSNVIPLFNYAPAEHVLFAGFSGQQNYKMFRTRSKQPSVRTDPWSLDFKFSQRTINEGSNQFGWNHMYAPKKGQWVKLRRKDTDEFLYQTTDFRNLFRAGPQNVS